MGAAGRNERELCSPRLESMNFSPTKIANRKKIEMVARPTDSLNRRDAHAFLLSKRKTLNRIAPPALQKPEIEKEFRM